MTKPLLETLSLSKSYGGQKIISDISIHVSECEMVSLLGVSGIGKTTLFNVLSGLEKPDSGEVILDGEPVTGKTGKIGYMQQSDLLLPFKKVAANAAIPLTLSGEKRKDAEKRAGEILDEFGLGPYKNCYPAQLSGGMRQRAALARTFLYNKKLVLLDEPFSALDAMTRAEMQKWFKNIIRTNGMSTLFITHDINEAIILSDRVYIMSGTPGRITSEIKIDVSNGEYIELNKDFIETKRKILEAVSENL